MVPGDEGMELSIIVPTYNEGSNVRVLTERIMGVLQSTIRDYEIIFVDDSSDDTPIILKGLTEKFPRVRYIHRVKERGLGSAVVNGFSLAIGEYLVVMDADLQHPPELLPKIVESLKKGNQLVIPSRFITGGSYGGLNFSRKLISWGARSIARLALKKVRLVSDCTGGFFGLHRSVIDGVDLNPIGWKIMLEIIVKGRYRSFSEIPYAFAPRDLNQSKMSFEEHVNYLRHIVFLVMSSPEDRKFFIFCSIGLLGFLVNMLVFTLLMQLTVDKAVFSSVTASSTALIHNFVWNDQVTWKQEKNLSRSGILSRFLKFASTSSLGVLIASMVVMAFVGLGWSPFIGQTLGIFAATFLKFFINDRWTWANTHAENHTR
jgi:dolichol-phosphate mannosyltransferase